MTVSRIRAEDRRGFGLAAKVRFKVAEAGEANQQITFVIAS
jgi:hypothetical protein